MSADDPRRLILRVCQMFYREDLSQSEIGTRLGLSRFQVARLLRRGLEDGYVVIKILEPTGWHSDLERELEHRYGLSMAVVVDHDGQGVAEMRRRVADAAGRLLVEIVADDMVLGISLGQTMQDLVDQLPDRIPRRATVVQLIGGTPLAVDLATRFGTEPLVMYAPAFVGIGSITEPDASRLVYGGALGADDVRHLRDRGAVGDVLAYLFDDGGNVIESGLEDRVLAIGLDDLLRTPRRVGVAAGIDKATAIGGALRGGFVNTLVTDSSVARFLCEGDQHA
jgi:deoxyribonucleoside regulator